MIEQRYDKNHRQPRYSKRPHDLPAREKNKITFAQPTLRILQNRPYTTKWKSKRRIRNGQIPCTHTKSPFSIILVQAKHVLWKAWVSACQLLTVFSVLLNNQRTTIKAFKWLIKKEWTSGACWGVWAHSSHPPLPTGLIHPFIHYTIQAVQRHFHLHAFNNRIFRNLTERLTVLLRRFIKPYQTK